MVDQKITISYNNSIVTNWSHNMSKKHFELFARKIRTIQDMPSRKVMARLVAEACAESNSMFDQVRFYQACGIK